MFSGSSMDGLWQHQDVKTPKKCLVYPPGTTADLLIGDCTTTKPPSQTSSCPFLLVFFLNFQSRNSCFRLPTRWLERLTGYVNKLPPFLDISSMEQFQHRGSTSFSGRTFSGRTFPPFIKSHHQTHMTNWLVVSTQLKHISQIESFPQVGVKIKHILETTT